MNPALSAIVVLIRLKNSGDESVPTLLVFEFKGLLSQSTTSLARDSRFHVTWDANAREIPVIGKSLLFASIKDGFSWRVRSVFGQLILVIS